MTVLTILMFIYSEAVSFTFNEIHYSQRKDGTDPTVSMVKFGLAPTFVPTGERSAWARPHFRFVFSLARYNDATMKNLYSPYLSLSVKKLGLLYGNQGRMVDLELKEFMDKNISPYKSGNDIHSCWKDD